MRSASLQRLFAAALAATASVGMSATRTYFVEPKTSTNGWTEAGQNTYVAQSFVANVDSIYYVEWFVGELSAPGLYRFEIRDEATNDLVCFGEESVPARGWRWIRCDNWTQGSLKFTKGREYTLKVRHHDGDSVNFVYRTDNPYTYGAISVGGGKAHPPPQSSNDLCLRLFGRMNAVDSAWWGYQTWAGGVPAWLNSRGVPAKAESAGVGMARIELLWSRIWPDSADTFCFTYSDTEVVYATQTLGCKVIGLLDYTAGWASSRIESTRTHGDTVDTFWSEHCPPRHLFAPDTSDTNYWYRYVKGVVEHYSNIISVWEIWNEPNDTAGFWQVPDTPYYEMDDPVHDMCSLYARLCVVAERAVRSVAPEDTVLIGSLACLQVDVESRMNPAEMLSYCYEYGQGAGWDGVSAHHYSNSDTGFVPAAFEAYAETLRAVMRDNGDYGGLWLTETGWPAFDTADSSIPPRYLCKAFTMAAGTGALPQGGYDRICYYSFRGDTLFGLLDRHDDPRPAFYAACQTASALTGKRFNGRVMTGDQATDTLVRMYEFEDPTSARRTWVCWNDGDTERGVDVKLPVRTNSLAAESLAYTRTPPAFSPRVADDGWLSLTLNPRPAFISETSAPLRPDLKVDSMRSVQSSQVVVRAWVTNHGTRATPRRSRVPYPTWAVLTANGDSLAQVVRTTSIAVNQQAEFTFDVGQTQLPDTVLFSVTVNPSQTYVELGTDDNTGHALVVRP